VALKLHDLADAEALAGSIASKTGGLSADDREDLKQFLLAECWRLSLNYDAAGRPPRFAHHAAGVLKLRVVDWRRSRFGRTKRQFAGHVYERARPQFVSLDADDEHNRDQLAGAVTEGSGAPQDGWAADLRGLLGEGDRQAARDHELLGLPPPRRAA
jgi:hypothetical protein